MRIVARNTVDAEIAVPCAHGCEAVHSRQGTMFVGSQLLPDAMSATRRFQDAVGTAPADHGFARLCPGCRGFLLSYRSGRHAHEEMTALRASNTGTQLARPSNTLLQHTYVHCRDACEDTSDSKTGVLLLCVP